MICNRLRQGEVRALTVTGTGGVGKTRLALQAASELRFDFEDGVHVIELAPLSDPALLPQAIARAVGLRDQPGRSITDTLTRHLRDKHLLLLLDNFEHLLANGAHNGHAAAFVAELLAACPAVGELVTSRSPLGRATPRNGIAPCATPSPGAPRA